MNGTDGNKLPLEFLWCGSCFPRFADIHDTPYAARKYHVAGATSFPGSSLFLSRGRKREDPGNEVGGRRRWIWCFVPYTSLAPVACCSLHRGVFLLITFHPPPVTLHPPHVTLYPSPVTFHSSPVTRHPPPVEKTCRAKHIITSNVRFSNSIERNRTHKK